MTVEVATLVDDDPEPYEDLTVTIGGGFDSLASVAPQTLAVYDARKAIDDLLVRVEELIDEVAEQQADVDVLERDRIRQTDVEADLVVRGIVTGSGGHGGRFAGRGFGVDLVGEGQDRCS